MQAICTGTERQRTQFKRHAIPLLMVSETRRGRFVQEPQFAREAVERPLGVRMRGVRPRGLQLATPHGLVLLREIAHDVLPLVPLAAS